MGLIEGFSPTEKMLSENVTQLWPSGEVPGQSLMCLVKRTCGLRLKTVRQAWIV